MRRRAAPDWSGICFQMSSNLRLFVNCWWNRKHAYSDARSVFLNNIICFHVWQEILQHGRSFEVEKALSDERYQTLKVSECETTHSLTFSSLMLLWKWFAFSLLRTLSSSKLWKLLTPSVKSLSFQSMPSWLRACLLSCQLFTSVFGVGPKTAEKWYRRGLRSFSDVLADRSIHLNRMQQNGTSTPPSVPHHSTN